METVNLSTVIESDGKMRLEVPCSLPPGPAEVAMVIRSIQSAAPALNWQDYYGSGKEIWGAEDAQDYVNRLRDEWAHEAP
jgi:hypothetical protein